MDYQNIRTKYGKLMFNFTTKIGKFLVKHIWLYYILNYTWGLIMTIFGWLSLSLICLFDPLKIKNIGKFGPVIYLTIGDNWGGLSLGTTTFVADNMGDLWTVHTKCHELGHTFQNAILGPFMIFLVSIPSAIRYWYQKIRAMKDKTNKPYDAFWAEGSATEIGIYFYKNYLE